MLSDKEMDQLIRRVREQQQMLSDKEMDQLICLVVKHDGGEGRTEGEIEAICRWARIVRLKAALLDCLFAEQAWVSGFKDGEPRFAPLQAYDARCQRSPRPTRTKRRRAMGRGD